MRATLRVYGRYLTFSFALLGALLIAERSARADHVFASGVSTVVGPAGTLIVNNIDRSAHGTSETDDQFTNLAGGAAGGSVTLRYSWPVAPNLERWTYQGEYVILWIDSAAPATGSTAEVVGYNGGTAVGGSDVVSIPTIAINDRQLNINWSGPAFGTEITDLDIEFVIGAADSINLDAVSNPEPGTLALVGMGLLGFVAWGARRRKMKK